MFNAPAEPAPNVMHIIDMNATGKSTWPGAIIIPVSAVKTTSNITRGFSSDI
jgi:hypothetical protein